VADNVQSDVFEVIIEDKTYFAAVLPMPSAESKDRVVTLVLGSPEKAASSLGVLNVILVMTVLVLFAVFITGMLLTNHFLRPIMAIEEGLLKIINGAYDYRFDVESDEVGGLSYRINQLVGVLTGEEEENEE
jgi:nitrate/nitrite-specific signal transduction histidine kinase